MEDEEVLDEEELDDEVDEDDEELDEDVELLLPEGGGGSEELPPPPPPQDARKSTMKDAEISLFHIGVSSICNCRIPAASSHRRAPPWANPDFSVQLLCDCRLVSLT